MKLLRELLCAAATVTLLASVSAVPRIAMAGEQPPAQVEAPIQALLDKIQATLNTDPSQADLADLLLTVSDAVPQMSPAGRRIMIDYFAHLHADADKVRDAEPAKSIKLAVFADIGTQYVRGNETGEIKTPDDSPPVNAATKTPDTPPPVNNPPPVIDVVPRVVNAPARPALLDRADTMLSLRDVVAARMLFERAIDSGSGMAAFKLAETYDPAFLADHDFRGIKPNPVEAEKWYRKAQDMGVTQAADRLRHLDGHSLANRQ
jgi:TPR repeat protein